MKKEISAVVIFLAKLLKNNKNLKEEEIDLFSEELSRILYDKYVDHWYPGTPAKGQAYRCIRVNRIQGVDPELQKACFHSGLVYEDLGLPKEMTLWVDPCEVCCRYGEKNPFFVVASFDSSDDKMEISQKVNHAVEKVTSDYHSGSSSDDEVYISQKPVPCRAIQPRTLDPEQVTEFVPQAAPTWNKNPKRRPASSYHYQPCFVPGYPPGRTKMYSQVPWMPPMIPTDRNHWNNLHRLSTVHQCLV
ncbi:protein BTG3 [Gastrophryne carolinensis]